VLHFHQPLAHAQHYVGCTASLFKRLTNHANGHGARLLEELMLQGLSWELGGLYSCSHAEMRRHERALKDFKQAHRFCQLCNSTKQATLRGCQKENIENVTFSRRSVELTTRHVDIDTTAELLPSEEEFGMAFILSLMKKDKDALGFVPVGGVKGIRSLLNQGQIILAYENGEPCGYSFYTKSFDRESINIHQACVADDARLKGHGEGLVEFIAAKHPEAKIVAKVRDDLAANHFWTAIGFQVAQTKNHKTSGSLIHHYERKGK
jgi:predicted GIY-YIG superfamily endonuclease/GNAT superfamily N-acetyltransferase